MQNLLKQILKRLFLKRKAKPNQKNYLLYKKNKAIYKSHKIKANITNIKSSRHYLHHHLWKNCPVKKYSILTNIKIISDHQLKFHTLKIWQMSIKIKVQARLIVQESSEFQAILKQRIEKSFKAKFFNYSLKFTFY